MILPEFSVTDGRRWTALVLTRLALALGTVVTITMMEDLPVAERDTLVRFCLAYSAVVLTAEAIRRLTGARAIWLVNVLVLVDGLFLAQVVNATGGTLSPLNALVYVHIVALTLVVSARAGLEAALWNAALVIITAGDVDRGLLGSGLWSERGEVAFRVTTYLIVAIAAAAYASMDERAYRRGQTVMVEQIDLLSLLEQARTTDLRALVLGRHLVGVLGFARAVVAVPGPDGVQAVVVEAGPDGLRHIEVELAHRDGGIATWPPDDGRPVALAALDADRHGELVELLPDAKDVVLVSLTADDHRCGSMVAEWPTGRLRTIPSSVLDKLRVSARYGAMSLRTSMLLAELEDQSRRDVVTGLANRRAFQDAMDSEISRVHRGQREASIVLYDLDHFKQVNDSAGHQAGDEVLTAVGQALEHAARPHDLVARIGGDEFAMILTDCGRTDATVVAERARRAVADAVGHRGVTICGGVASVSPHDVRSEDVMDRADRALYRAKEAGRDRVRTAPERPGATLLVDLTDDQSPDRRGDQDVTVTST